MKKKQKMTEGVYDRTPAARYEAFLLRGLRPIFVCERCHRTDPRQLVLIQTSWDRIVNRFRTETEVPQEYNKNVRLCPVCMEELNGGPFEDAEVGRKTDGEPIPCNEWYMYKGK